MPEITLITSYGCTPCLRIKRILMELQERLPDLTLQEVEFTSLAGSQLAIQNGVLYPPAVFLEGKLLAKGKIDTGKMISSIQEWKLP